MKSTKRWYYLLFKMKNCFKMSLLERTSYKHDPINFYRHIYLGNDWWLIKKIK